MNDTWRCTRCGFETTDTTLRCPSCKIKLISVKRLRLIGWVQIALGVILVGLMGTVTFFTAPALLKLPGQQSGMRFTGSEEVGTAVLVLFGLIILLGLTSIAAGVFQVKNARRNRWILYFLLIVVVVLIGWTVRVLQMLPSS